jgi:hypothetical protein
MTQIRKGKTIHTLHMQPGELLNMDLAFWDVFARRGFNAIFIIIDAKTQMVWFFCTASKKPPLHILHWLFMNLCREKRLMAHIRVEGDGDLSKSTAFCKYIRESEALHLKITGRYAFYLNGKVEHPNYTIDERVRCFLHNTDCPKQD